MKSEIKIDYIDRGKGSGIEPVIRVELKSSSDPRDTLIQALFQSIQEQNFIQFEYVYSDTYGGDGKTIYLFKPDIERVN